MLLIEIPTRLFFSFSYLLPFLRNSKTMYSRLFLPLLSFFLQVLVLHCTVFHVRHNRCVGCLTFRQENLQRCQDRLNKNERIVEESSEELPLSCYTTTTVHECFLKSAMPSLLLIYLPSSYLPTSLPTYSLAFFFYFSSFLLFFNSLQFSAQNLLVFLLCFLFLFH